MRFPGVFERIVNVSYRIGKSEASEVLANLIGGGGDLGSK